MKKEEAEVLAEVIKRCEPEMVVGCSKRWFSRRWQVCVVRDGERYEYQDISQYCLERALAESFDAMAKNGRWRQGGGL